MAKISFGHLEKSSPIYFMNWDFWFSGFFTLALRRLELSQSFKIEYLEDSYEWEMPKSFFPR